MIYTVAFDRLTVPSDGKDENGKRIYDQRVVDAEVLTKIQECIMRGLGLI